MSYTRKQAIKRIKMLKAHFSPSEDFNREMDGCTFNFDLASEVFRKLRPEVHHKIVKMVESDAKENYRKERPRDAIREQLNS